MNNTGKRGINIRIMLIYPKYPLKNIVDTDWLEEYNAVSKISCIETGLYDEYEKKLIFSKLSQNNQYIFLYRGWMLEPESVPKFKKFYLRGVL